MIDSLKAIIVHTVANQCNSISWAMNHGYYSQLSQSIILITKSDPIIDEIIIRLTFRRYGFDDQNRQ